MPHRSLPRTRYGVRGLARTQHRSTSNPQTDRLTRIAYLPAHRIGNRVRDVERLDPGDLRRRLRGIGMPRNWQPHVQAKQRHKSSLHASSPLGISPGTQSLRRTGRRRVPSGRSPRFFSVASRPPEPAAATCPKQGTGTQQPHREAPCQSLGRLSFSHTTPPEPYRADFPSVRPRSTPLAVADVSTVALATLAAALRGRRTSLDQFTFLHVPAIRQSHAEPPIPPCLPLTASVPRTGRRRVPSGRSAGSLSVTPRRPNPIAPSSLRSGRALTPTLRTFTRSRSLRSQPPSAVAGPLRTSSRSCMHQPSANPMPNLRSHHACHSQHPCAAPGGVELLPVARLASFRSPHIHQNPQPPSDPNKEQAPNSHNVRLPASRSAGSLAVTPRCPNPIAPTSLRSDRALHPSPLQTCQRSRSLRSQPPSAVAGPLWISSRSCMYQPSANPMPNLRSHHTCHSQHPCPAPGGVELLPVARLASFRSPHIHQNPQPPSDPNKEQAPNSHNVRLPASRSAGSLAVTPRCPNPIAPSSLRSDRALHPSPLQTCQRSRSLRSQPPSAVAGPLWISSRSCMYQPSANPMPNLRSHHTCHSQHPCPAPGGVELLPVARLASFRSPHIHQNPQPPSDPNKEQAPNSHNVRLPASRSAGSLSVTPRCPNPIAPSSLRSGRALHPSPLQTCQRSRSLRSQPPSAVAGPLWISSRSCMYQPSANPMPNLRSHHACHSQHPCPAPGGVEFLPVARLASFRSPHIHQNPQPPSDPNKEQAPNSHNVRLPASRSAGSLAVTPRCPNPIAPSSLRSGRALTLALGDVSTVALAALAAALRGRRTSLDQVRLLRANFFPARQNPHPTTRRPQRTATGDPSTTNAEYGSLRLAAKDSP